MLLALPSFGSELCTTVIAAIATVTFGRGRRLCLHDPEQEIAKLTARIRARANRHYILRVPRFLSRWIGWA